MASSSSRSSSPFVSVYVPSTSESKSHSDFHRPQKSRSIRRVWNRLSRLQKSFLLMMLLIMLLFGAIVTSTSWIPPDREANRYVPHKTFNELPNSDGRQAKGVDNNIIESQNSLYLRNQGERAVIQKESVAIPTQQAGGGRGRSKGRLGQKWNLQVSSSSVPTIPRALQPDFGDAVTEPEVKIAHNQIKENIRAVISLDPVVDLGKKGAVGGPGAVMKPGKLFSINKPAGTKLKFEGPTNARQQAVTEAFLHAWNGYKTYAWGRDNLKPISRSGSDWFGLGLTLVDSLDTMYIMGLNREFYEARDWVEEYLRFDGNKNVNLFETTIRVMGGLLSAYHLSGDVMFLNKAKELGETLKVAFNSPSGVPYSDVNLRSKTAHGPSWNPDSTTSEVSTIQLEFRDLSRCTKINDFEQAAMNVSVHIHNLRKLQGLVPINISPSTGQFRSSAVITLGARGDSYYEYLVKQWIQTGKKIDFLRDDYLYAVEGMKSKLLQRTHPSNLTFLGELESQGKSFKPKMDHLVCYLAGTLALGVSHGLPEWHMDLAKELMYTCYLTYKRMPTGLAPEITYFRTESDSIEDFYVRSNDAHNLLRPESVESLWYMYQITGDKKYQDWGWEIFQAFEKYTRTEHGYTSISNVLQPDDVRPRDMMESFFLGETLKYFYLLFSDKPIFDLNQWVFNTEAHPFPVHDH